MNSGTYSLQLLSLAFNARFSSQSLLQHKESIISQWLQVARIDMGKIKDFSIVLFGTEVYNPGSLVNGYVVLELSAPRNCKCISIVLSGKATSGSD